MKSVFFSVGILLVCFCNSGIEAVAKQPNILFIFSDDHALQAIGAYGSKINQTPNLDRIAKAGAVFHQSFCANSICGPSRACILTGKHSYLNGFLRNSDRFDGSQTTFPKLLQQVGYQTAIIGKWHLATNPVGFDHWEILPGQGSYYNPDFIQMDQTRKSYRGYVTDIITDRTLQWLKEQRDPEKPFVLMCQHKAPHRNWSPPSRYFSLFKDVDIPEPDTLFDDYAGRSKLLEQNEMTLKDHFFWGWDAKLNGKNQFPEYFLSGLANGEYLRMNSEQKAEWDAAYHPENQAFIERVNAGKMNDKDVLRWKYQRYIKDYLRCIQAVDDSVGNLLDYLDETKLADDTIVIYSSDQGFYLGEHGWYDKRWMFEESLKMPFLIRWPGVVEPGIASTAMIQNIDYAPTFLEVAGAPVPEEIQGRSLVPILKNQGKATDDWRDAIYYAYYENGAAHNVPIHDGIRTERYKLIFFPRTREWNLFDLQKDPKELRSVHKELAYSEVFSGLKKQYHQTHQFYQVNTAAIPASRLDEPNWRARDAAITRKAREGNADLAFIGDSITQGWEGAGASIWKEFYGDRNAINLGIGGDRTEHVIWRLQHGNLGKIQPKVAVVMIGTNNTGQLQQDPTEVAGGVKRILDLLKERRPDTKVLLLGVFPRGKYPSDVLRKNNEEINNQMERYADGEHIHYMDIGSVFLEADGTIRDEVMPDYLHPSSEGYARWAKAIEPKLRALGGWSP